MNNISRQFVGNDKLFKNLIDSFKNKTLSNSLIFTGPKGMGKTTLALFLIKNIFKNLSNDNQVNHHINLIYNNTHPNLKYLKKDFDEKNNKFKTSINIEQIRNLENFLYQSSSVNLPKFILIDSADDLNDNSANALLKALEEPNLNTYFILITHQLSNLLPTLRSRCIKFYIKKPNLNQFTQIFNYNNKIKKIYDFDFLYHLSNSSPGLALEIISENINQLYESVIKILHINESLSTEVISLANLLGSYSNEKFKIFLLILRFILMTIIKINLGFNFKYDFYSTFYDFINNKNIQIENSTSLEILEYLNNNEIDLFVYNLDKKIFSLNIFASLNRPA